jgi:hypothetical protein
MRAESHRQSGGGATDMQNPDRFELRSKPLPPAGNRC